jgi:hypothetical protein
MSGQLDVGGRIYPAGGITVEDNFIRTRYLIASSSVSTLYLYSAGDAVVDGTLTASNAQFVTATVDSPPLTPTSITNKAYVDAVAGGGVGALVVGDVASGTWSTSTTVRSLIGTGHTFTFTVPLTVTNLATFTQYFAVDMHVSEGLYPSATETLEINRDITVVASGVTKALLPSTSSLYKLGGSSIMNRSDCFSFVLGVPAGDIAGMTLTQTYYDRRETSFRALNQDGANSVFSGRIYVTPLAVRP